MSHAVSFAALGAARTSPFAAAALAAAVFATPADARAESAPIGRSYVVMMTQPQIASGVVRHLLPPLTAALDRAGLKNAKGPGAEWVVTVETSSDHGAWLGSGESRRWRHNSTVSVGFAPNEGFPRKADVRTFTVDARVVTADPDRHDEYRCLVDLAVATAMKRWQSKGRIAVRGVECERGE